MKSVRIAISVVLLVGSFAGSTLADALQKYGDCSHLKVDQRESLPIPCTDATGPQCAWQQVLVHVRGIKRCDRQALFGAHMAALAFRLDQKSEAFGLYLTAMSKIAFIGDVPKATFTAWDMTNALAYGGMETTLKDMAGRWPPPMGAVWETYLARRRADQCDMDKAKAFIEQAESDLAANTKVHPVRMHIHGTMAQTYAVMGDIDSAARHADEARRLRGRLGDKFVAKRDMPILVGADAAAHRFDAAKAEADRIEDAAVRALAQSVLAESYAFLGDRVEALKTIERAETSIEMITEPRARGQAQRRLSIARARAVPVR